MKDIEFRVDDAREVCESVYKRLCGVYDGVHTALLRAENTHIKAHIDEKEFQRLAKLLKAEEQLLNQHLEKQKGLWHTSLARQRRDLKSNKGIWLLKKAFHTWLWFFLLPLCYTIISICYFMATYFYK